MEHQDAFSLSFVVAVWGEGLGRENVDFQGFAASFMYFLVVCLVFHFF